MDGLGLQNGWGQDAVPIRGVPVGGIGGGRLGRRGEDGGDGVDSVGGEEGQEGGGEVLSMGMEEEEEKEATAGGTD